MPAHEMPAGTARAAAAPANAQRRSHRDPPRQVHHREDPERPDQHDRERHRDADQHDLRPVGSPLSPASAMICRTWKPIRKKTVFSSRNSIVDQIVRSKIRDEADCSRYDLWLSDEPRDHDGQHAGAVQLLGEQVGEERGDQRDRGVGDLVLDAACAPCP